MSACFCIGRQNGEPYCPCEMRQKGIVNRNGRWIEPEKDLGEAPKLSNDGLGEFVIDQKPPQLFNLTTEC